MMAPNMTMDTRKLTLDATRKIPMWKRLGGRIGSGGFLSPSTNTVRVGTAGIERAMMIGEHHRHGEHRPVCLPARPASGRADTGRGRRARWGARREVRRR